MGEFTDRIKRYATFSLDELKDLFIVIFIGGFIFSFNDWGIETFSFFIGLTNLSLSIIVMALAMFFHVFIQKAYAVLLGMKADFKIWYGGLVASLVIVFASAPWLGKALPILLPGGVVSSLLIRHRLGEFRYGFSYWENGFIALVGPLASLFFAFLFKISLYFSPSSYILQKGLLINTVLAVVTMFPLPNLNGINLFFASRLLYVFCFFSILGAAVLLYFVGIIPSIVFGLIIGVIAWLTYYFKIEAK